ncbi:MAG: RNA polymerase factor sigma-54 [Akkermansiaceae bacterium]|nr:RNA polymerase factor sigma-54 [Akkermansiaceae bacterium]
MPESFLQQNLSQTQTLAPQMRKSLEILQASSMELSQIINQALQNNPALEDGTESISLDELSGDPEEADRLDDLNETDDDWRDRHISEGSVQPWTQDDEERRQHLYDSMVAPVTLQQHLQQQLDQSMVDDEVRKAANAIIGNLDERGFLDMPLRDLGIRLQLNPEALDQALSLVQSFDPAGVGAADIRDSLLLQLERDGRTDSIEYRIVKDHLDSLARRRHPQIAKALGTSIERITEAAASIGRLTPNPGGDFNPGGNPYIQPDVIIEKNEDGRLEARLTGEQLPNLRINDFYKDMIGKEGLDTKARTFLREQIRDGRSLIRSVALRQETILAIAHQLIARQQDFFDKGPRFLKPLTMNEVADALGMHATTISRAVAGKHILTPQGLMEMRAFFATGYQTASGTEVSNAGVRQAIQELVANENHAKPLSDEALTKALAAQGIKVARRTVAKYREQLNILPSHLRKSY